MNALALQKTTLAPELATKYVAAPAFARLSPQPNGARLRRKGPIFWAALALLVLSADALLALLAWVAVDLVLN
ncbi:hypothetical protein B5V03_14010 [Bradyrhizobium betae]|uniref:Uncharacterized protein n=1 Tax=Bradyrhizobium betae TaxID=244734 RepID=A0A4V1P6W1_9BRAD|nr:hypothetical protein B5V03_14010 [Bradyrhizobium betae]